MSLKVYDVIEYLEEIAPASLALKWDNSGLLLGHRKAAVNNLLVCLNYNLQVCQEALEREANLIISHHPLFLKPLQKIDTAAPLGALIEKTLSHKLNLYTAHTNLDLAAEGVSKALLNKLELADAGPLQPFPSEQLEKLVVFVPESHLEKVREALSEAGAGWIGNYSHC
ncbi:MAG TPA: Nif3-like dinuclear metal center hexameric protein, partial [Firmicutes bacterium]|nr:Nif3-like dinuclear metal center hexameric protein [Bacillota bacterium]